MVGSPPVTTTASTYFFRLSRIFNADSSFRNGGFGSTTIRQLWQNGQRRLQPGVKSTDATLFGKSTRLVFCSPLNFIGLITQAGIGMAGVIVDFSKVWRIENSAFLPSFTWASRA